MTRSLSSNKPAPTDISLPPGPEQKALPPVTNQKPHPILCCQLSSIALPACLESVYISPSCLPFPPAHPDSAACCKPYFTKKAKPKNAHISALRPPSSTLAPSTSLLPFFLLLEPSLVPPQASLPDCLSALSVFFSHHVVPLAYK